MKINTPKPDAMDLRAREYEQEIRAAVEAVGGIGGPRLAWLPAYFASYRLDPDPGRFIEALGVIEEFKLMALPEHRHGLAGAVVGVLFKHAEQSDGWRASKHRSVIATAERITIPLVDQDIANPLMVDYLWMFWMTTGDTGTLKRIVRLALQPGQVGEQAAVLLAAHAMLPEVAVQLDQLAASGCAIGGTPVPLPSAYTTVRKDIPHAEVKSLYAHLIAIPGTRQRLVLVAWLPGTLEVPQGFLAVTRDGHRFNGLPLEWEGYPVHVRRATVDEAKRHQAVLDAAEEP